MSQVNQFWRDSSGATAIEYGLLVGFIALVFVAGASAAGTQISAALLKITAMN